MTKILLLGPAGQVGHELSRSLCTLGTVLPAGRDSCDLADPDAIRTLLRRTAPDIVVNAAAYTAVDKAESDRDLAYAINAHAPRVLAEEASALGALLVHYSTDYVFDGKREGWYTEDDPPNPQSVYGRSKLDGEVAVRTVAPRHLIIRTSWVFGAHGGNFLKTILRLASERDSLRIIADQFGAPTSARLIAATTERLISGCMSSPGDRLTGTYHLVAGGETTWHEYAQTIVEEARRRGTSLKVSADQIAAIGTADYPLPARRPANSRLSTAKLAAAFGLTLPHWKVGVGEALDELARVPGGA